MFFFARIYFSQFSRFELHSRKIHYRENVNVDYFYRFRSFFVCFGCFFGYLPSSVVTAHSRKIHARENFGWPFANNRCARNIYVLQYRVFCHTIFVCMIHICHLKFCRHVKLFEYYGAHNIRRKYTGKS